VIENPQYLDIQILRYRRRRGVGTYARRGGALKLKRRGACESVPVCIRLFKNLISRYPGYPDIWILDIQIWNLETHKSPPDCSIPWPKLELAAMAIGPSSKWNSPQWRPNSKLGFDLVEGSCLSYLDVGRKRYLELCGRRCLTRGKEVGRYYIQQDLKKGKLCGVGPQK
jgi:hypothetical protein